MPTVSVIIPAYNALEFLPEALNSVFQQTYQDFEVIVVNDGSLDDIDRWATTIDDPRFRYISQENQGSSGARNTGIDSSEGELIAFLDADDLWQPTKLAKQVQSIEEDPNVDLVYTWLALMDEKGELTGKVYNHSESGNVWQKLTQRNILECGSIALVRRSCFKTLGKFDRNLSWGEDWDMWLRIAAKGAFQVIQEPLVYYRKHSNNISHNWAGKEKDYHLVIEKNFASVSDDLKYLKNRSYGSAYLTLAWKSLQSSQKDYRKAIDFKKKALEYYPKLWLSKEYIRLSTAIALTRWLKPSGYEKTRSFVYSLMRFRFR